MVALAPLIEKLLAIAAPEVEALVGKLITVAAADPTHATDLVQTASVALTKLQATSAVA